MAALRDFAQTWRGAKAELRRFPGAVWRGYRAKGRYAQIGLGVVCVFFVGHALLTAVLPPPTHGELAYAMLINAVGWFFLGGVVWGLAFLGDRERHKEEIMADIRTQARREIAKVALHEVPADQLSPRQ